jgi:hypothetical protein
MYFCMIHFNIIPALSPVLLSYLFPSNQNFTCMAHSPCLLYVLPTAHFYLITWIMSVTDHTVQSSWVCHLLQLPHQCFPLLVTNILLSNLLSPLHIYVLWYTDQVLYPHKTTWTFVLYTTRHLVCKLQQARQYFNTMIRAAFYQNCIIYKNYLNIKCNKSKYK